MNLRGIIHDHFFGMKELRIEVTHAERQLQLHVVDTGPGIAADKLSLIWLPYVRGSGVAGHPGMGLGLALSRSIAEAHGGTLSLDDSPSSGAQFHLILPASHEK